MARYRSFRDLDWPLLIISLIICALGVLADLFRHARLPTVPRRLVEANHLDLHRIGTYVGGHLHRLPHSTGPGPASLRSLQSPLLLATFALGRHANGARRWITVLAIQSSDLGICEISDNIAGSAVPLGAEERRGERSRLVETRRVGRDSDGAGDGSSRISARGPPTCRSWPPGFCWPGFNGVMWW